MSDPSDPWPNSTEEVHELPGHGWVICRNAKSFETGSH